MASPPHFPLTISARNWILLLLLSLVWGSSFLWIKIAVAEIPPLTLALARIIIAAAILIPLVSILWGWPQRPPWRAFLVAGLLNNAIPFSLLFWGQSHIPTGLASILNATAPLFSAVVAHWMTSDDRLTAGRVVGLVAGFGGVVIMIGPDLLREVGTNVLAECACLLTALFYAFGAIFTRRFRAMPPPVVATCQLCASALLMAVPVALIDRPWTLPAPSWPAIAALAILAVVATVLAYVIYFHLIARTGATNTLLVSLISPPSAILIGIFVLGEHLDARRIAGMAAIMVGLIAIDSRPLQALWRVAVRAGPR